MTEVGRDLCRSSGRAPLCSSKATQSRLLSTVSRRLLHIAKGGDSTASLGNLCQGSVTLTGKKCFLMFRGHLLCFSLRPLPLVLSLDTTEKSLALSSLHPPFGYLYTLMRSSLSLLFPSLNHPSPPAANTWTRTPNTPIHWARVSGAAQVPGQRQAAD